MKWQGWFNIFALDESGSEELTIQRPRSSGSHRLEPDSPDRVVALGFRGRCTPKVASVTSCWSYGAPVHLRCCSTACCWGCDGVGAGSSLRDAASRYWIGTFRFHPPTEKRSCVRFKGREDLVAHGNTSVFPQRNTRWLSTTPRELSSR